LLLLDDGRIVQGASSESALDQEPMQLIQRRYRHARCAEGHSDAGGGIEHPCRHHDDHAGRHLDVNSLAAGAPLNILAPNAPPIEGVPLVTNFNFLPDMGRMTPRLSSIARMLSSPVTITARRTGPASPRSSKPAYAERGIRRSMPSAELCRTRSFSPVFVVTGI
jgi:hypothetical protein